MRQPTYIRGLFRNELHQWNNTVNSLRTADQIVFPLESEETIKIETADQRICSSRVSYKILLAPPNNYHRLILSTVSKLKQAIV